MEQDLLISIIIPVYNTKDCLIRCVQSVCGQTYTHLEILLVDDGSDDGSGKLCDKLEKTDARIRVFHKQNGGSSSARNLGLVHAKGTYIGFVDSDDYIEPDMYEHLICAILKHRVLMAQISRDEIDADGNRMPDVCKPPNEETMITAEQMMEELLMHRGDCSFCTRLTHRDLFIKQQFPEGKLNEDFFLLIRMLPLIQSFVILPKQGYHVFYRIGSNSRKKDKNEFPKVYTDIVDNADFAGKLTEEYFPRLQRIALRFALYQRMDYLLHIPIPMMRRDNLFYRERVCRYLKKNKKEILCNPYLTRKNKMYLLLFAIAPKTVRKVHAFLHSLHS